MIGYSETEYQINVSFRKPTRRYMDEFVRLTCAPDLLAAKVFPNAKEITESMTVFNAVRKQMGCVCFGDEEITLVDVACGGRPRTAALFACRTKWRCLAVDPNLTVDGCRIRRVHCYKTKIEEMPIYSDKPVVVVAVHPHVDLNLIEIHSPSVLMVAMPCCMPLDLGGNEGDIIYNDMGCWSPKRIVKIWKIRPWNGGMVN